MGWKDLIKAKEEVNTPAVMTNIIISMMQLFKGSVGEKHGKTLGEMYKQAYGKEALEEDGQYLKLYKTMLIERAINTLKKKTKYFIISSHNGTNRVWYLVHNQSEAEDYCKTVDYKIKGLNWMKARCAKAVNEQYYNQLEEITTARKLITKQKDK